MFYTIAMIVLKTFGAILVVDVLVFAALYTWRQQMMKHPTPVQKQDDMWFEQWRKGDFYDL